MVEYELFIENLIYKKVYLLVKLIRIAKIYLNGIKLFVQYKKLESPSGRDVRWHWKNYIQ